MRRLAGVAVLLVALAPACGGSKKPEAPPPPNSVILKNSNFKPAKLTVKAGTTVTWLWRDGTVQHDVAFDGFKSKVKTSGDYTHTFDQAGTFAYKCEVHPTTMK